MATAREEGNPYEGGLGAGGKFRKRPLRRATKTAPYDRPPTSIRNPSGTGDGNGWLSKLVDPARRLITSSAQRLFASVFTKRLPPPPQLMISGTNEELREDQPEAISAVPPVVQGAIIGCGNPINHTEETGVDELEEILKQKTFTRSETDRLTSLLRSRSAYISGGNEEKRSALISMVSHDKKEEFPKTPIREDVTENHIISTPLISSTAADEVGASPAELAKAYMGCRTTNVSVSRHGLQNQVHNQDMTFPSNTIFSSTPSTMLFRPRTSGPVGSPRISSVIPRLRGRSAIYSMARTPYSRVNSAIPFKSSGTASDAFGGSSSPLSAWEQNRISGSRQGVFKRRNSVLDNDIGSVGPIRRIRQKSNLLSSRTLSLPASAGPLSANVAGTSSSGLDSLAENGDNSTHTSFTTVPSKSSQVASKILQQLDIMVSPGEKTPTKLSPSMLRGQALKSLETVDSSKFLENMNDTDELNGSRIAPIDFQDSISHKHDNVKENGSILGALPDKPVPAANGVDSNSLMKDNDVSCVNAAEASAIKYLVQQPQQKSPAFQMSAHEDYLDLDDDNYPNESTDAEAIGSLDNCVMGCMTAAAEVIEKPSILSEVEPISIASTNAGEVSSVTGSSGVKLITRSNQNLENSSSIAAAAPGTTNYFPDKTDKENNLNQIFCRTPEAAITSSESTSTSAGIIFKFDASNNGSLASSPFSFSSPAPSLVPSTSQSSSSAAATNSDASAAASTSASTTANATCSRTPHDTVIQPPLQAAPVFKFSSSVDLPTSVSTLSATPGEATNSKTKDTSIGNVGIFPFGGTPAINSSGSSIFGGTSEAKSAASSTTGTTAEIARSGNSSFSGLSSTISNSGSGLFSSTFSTVTSTGNSIFGGTSATTSTGNAIFGGTSATASTGCSTSGGLSSAIAGSESSIFSNKSAIMSSGSSIFGFSATSVSTSTAQTQGLNPSNAVNTQASAVGTSIGTSIQSMPIQFSSSASSPSFGLTGNTTFSSGSSMFGSSASIDKSFGSGATFGVSSSSETNPQSSSSGIASGTFGSNWQAPKTPIFGSSSSGFGFESSSVGTPSTAPSIGSSTGASSSGFVFGSSSVSAPSSASSIFGSSTSASSSGFVFGSSSVSAPSSAPSIFGSSTIAAASSGFGFGSSSVSAPSSAPSIFGSSSSASSGSIFSFTSSSAATSSQHAFGNTSPGLVFGATPSTNNDQMEDSMAEDTFQASPTVAPFGQQPISPPASGFVFGASNPSGGSFHNGSQPSIAAPQNPSSFLASGSLEFGAGGSFSLGTSGGDKSARKYVKVRKQRKK